MPSTPHLTADTRALRADLVQRFHHKKTAILAPSGSAVGLGWCPRARRWSRCQQNSIHFVINRWRAPRAPDRPTAGHGVLKKRFQSRRGRAAHCDTHRHKTWHVRQQAHCKHLPMLFATHRSLCTPNTAAGGSGGGWACVACPNPTHNCRSSCSATQPPTAITVQLRAATQVTA